MAFDRYALTEMRAPDSTLLRSGKRLGGGGGGGDGDGDGDDCAAAANDRTVRTNAPRIVQVRATLECQTDFLNWFGNLFRFRPIN